MSEDTNKQGTAALRRLLDRFGRVADADVANLVDDAERDLAALYDEGHADACNGILKRSQIQMFTNDQLAVRDAQLLEADHVKLLDYLSFHSRDSQAYADAYQKVGEWVCEWTPLAGVTNSPAQIRDEAMELATLVTGYAGSPMLLARMQEMAKKVLRSASVKPVAQALHCPTCGEDNLKSSELLSKLCPDLWHLNSQ